jgi:16S rRNA (guanine527-N7)-methyltransferase
VARSTSRASFAHAPALEALGIPDAARAGLLGYLALLQDWNRRTNLTGARTPEEQVATIVAPALPIAPLLAAGPVLDVGSGNGSPGLVVALLRPDLEVTLIEPRAKRWAFLREAARAAGRPDVAVFRGRHQDWTGAPAQSVLLRALRLPLEELRPLVRAGGLVVVVGRSPEPAPGFRPEAGPRPDVHLYTREG